MKKKTAKIILKNIEITNQRQYKKFLKGIELLAKSTGEIPAVTFNELQLRNLRFNCLSKNPVERDLAIYFSGLSKKAGE